MRSQNRHLKRGRNDQLVRVLRIVRELERLDGVDLYELAEKHSATVRTIRRDLAAIAELGFPLVEEREGKRKRWRLDTCEQETKLTKVLDASHYLALRLAMGGTPAAGGAAFGALEDLCDRIEQAVGKRGRRHLEAIERCFLHRDRFAYRRPATDVFWKIVEAIGDRRMCRVVYQSPVRPHESTFDALPLRVFSHDQALYLLVVLDPDNSILTLNLHRIRTLEVLRERREPPSDFDSEAWASSAFGVFAGARQVRFRLLFSAESAPYIRERCWHPSQKLSERRGGAVVLEFTCAASYEVTAWVASWRHHVEVLDPQSLRDDLYRLGNWLRGTYKKGQRRSRGRARVLSQ